MGTARNPLVQKLANLRSTVPLGMYLLSEKTGMELTSCREVYTHDVQNGVILSMRCVGLACWHCSASCSDGCSLFRRRLHRVPLHHYGERERSLGCERNANISLTLLNNVGFRAKEARLQIQFRMGIIAK